MSRTSASVRGGIPTATSRINSAAVPPALLEQVSTAARRVGLDVEARQAIFTEAQKLLVERCAAFWSYAQEFVNVLQPSVMGFSPHPTGYPIGFEEIWLAE